MGHDHPLLPFLSTCQFNFAPPPSPPVPPPQNRVPSHLLCSSHVVCLWQKVPVLFSQTPRTTGTSLLLLQNPFFGPFCHRIYGFSVHKESAYSAGDLGLTPGSGRSPGVGNGYPLQNSCLENSNDRGACGLQSMGSQESQTRLSTHTLY